MRLARRGLAARWACRARPFCAGHGWGWCATGSIPRGATGSASRKCVPASSRASAVRRAWRRHAAALARRRGVLVDAWGGHPMCWMDLMLLVSARDGNRYMQRRKQIPWPPWPGLGFSGLTTNPYDDPLQVVGVTWDTQKERWLVELRPLVDSDATLEMLLGDLGPGW